MVEKCSSHMSLRYIYRETFLLITVILSCRVSKVEEIMELNTWTSQCGFHSTDSTDMKKLSSHLNSLIYQNSMFMLYHFIHPTPSHKLSCPESS